MISGSKDGNYRTCCMSKVFKKFPSGEEEITSCWPHYDPYFKWRSYLWSPWQKLVIFTARLSKKCLQTINCLFITSKTAWHGSNTCSCFKKSKRDISVICWLPERRLKLVNTEFSPDYCYRDNFLSISNSIRENNPAGLLRHLHIVYFEIWLIQSNRGIIFRTINRYMYSLDNITHVYNLTIIYQVLLILWENINTD